jgi:hypothetical protein
MSSFISKKLDLRLQLPDIWCMANPPSSVTSRRITNEIRRRIKTGGDRLWRFEDFRDLPFPAVAKALSRLTRTGDVQRLSKGIYYRSRQTAFGKSRPNPVALGKLASKRNAVFPAGIAAANLLGFTTQNPTRPEVATNRGSLPRKLVGSKTVIHTRRPPAWTGLADEDAALLDFLRQRGRASELAPEQTVQRMISLLSEEGRFDRLLRVAATEPPRVRAMLGAIGQQIGKKPNALEQLRHSLNPLSRFDFGALAGLTFAHQWYAKEPRRK